MKATLLDHWRISIFRLAILYGLVFTIGNIALMGLIYWQTSSYLVHRIDDSIMTMSGNFTNLTPEQAKQQVHEALQFDLRKSNLYALFSSDGSVITGNMQSLPEHVPIDGAIHQFPHLGIPPYLSSSNQSQRIDGLARARFQRLSNGSILVVGRDFTQLAEIKGIILRALIGSGSAILIIGLLSGFAFSIRPLRRINAIRATSTKIMQGELSLRMPVSSRQDELDMLSGIVNLMLEEIERLLNEVKSVTDTVAHDLRTPLTRLRLTLYRAQQLPSNDAQHQLLDSALTETDSLLRRFRALLRISEIENRQRKSGFKQINLPEILTQILELFEPLAEEAQVALTFEGNCSRTIYADPDLLLEALSNLIDNAIKFTDIGGSVHILISEPNGVVQIDITDTGCGIPPAERATVLLRFHRSMSSQNHQQKEGFGLGLSIVAAILRLHNFGLEFKDNAVGTHVRITCANDSVQNNG
ncbi:sensor histidine kinase [Sapientia aquatica]|uniref:histidine kinase n=1 Tax=Sapientia aquatica TaxID=1549640 RepID=A0A4R5W2D4_9BURK|nr:HAMP domain-containing sensor histidine kinase [Sapientia aquatica]TDK66601.1 HAMP domain-containing histidine kinase [Sapientia aquatica]